MLGESVDFRDQQSVYMAGVVKPAVMFDAVPDGSGGFSYVRLKYGEYVDVMAYYEVYGAAMARFSAATQVPADVLPLEFGVIEVPIDQALIDDIFQSSGRFDKYIKSRLSGTDYKVFQ